MEDTVDGHDGANQEQPRKRHAQLKSCMYIYICNSICTCKHKVSDATMA